MVFIYFNSTSIIPGAIQEQLPKAGSIPALENSDDDLLDQEVAKSLGCESTYQGIGSTFSGESPCQEAKDLVNRPKVLEASDQPWKPESLPEIDPKTYTQLLNQDLQEAYTHQRALKDQAEAGKNTDSGLDPKRAQEATQEQVPSYKMSGANATQQSRSGGCCIS